MKIRLVMSLVFAASALSMVASADSACLEPPPLCPPVLDGGTCRQSGDSCAGDAGLCEQVPWDCTDEIPDAGGRLLCLGQRPAAMHPLCGQEGGCSIAADPRGAATRAALPTFLFVAGALLLLADRRRGARTIRK
jgi:hypothetical protein